MTAEQIIGASAPADRLDIAAIRSSLPDGAPLRTLLDEEIAGLSEMRKRDSAEAAGYKTRSRKLATLVVAGSGIAALASGFLLYGQGHDPDTKATGLVDAVTKATVAITIIQIVALLVATAASTIISTRDYGKLWTEARRKAETRRIEIFNKLLVKLGNQPEAGEDSELAQVFEFFRRYQLDLQIAYYDGAKGKLGKSADTVLYASALFSGLTAVVGLIGGLSLPGALVVCAFLGIATPVVLSALQSWAKSTRPEEKKESYRAAWEALVNLRLRLGEARASARAGDVAGVKTFIDDVHAVMSAENGAFAGLGPIALQEHQ